MNAAPDPPRAQARVGSDVALAATLLLTAGYLDAMAFVFLQGNFVAFMSGNTVVLSAAGTTGQWARVGLCAALIGLFFAGVVAGAAARRWAGRHAQLVVTLGVTGFAAAGAALATSGAVVAGFLLVVVACGLINCALTTATDVQVGLTYVTGTLVKAAHQLVDGIGGDRPWLWARTLSFWVIFAVGAVGGGVGYHLAGVGGLWVAVALAALTPLLPHRRVADTAATPSTGG